MTANTYVHATQSLQHDAADRIDALLGNVVNEAIAGNSRVSVPQRCHALPVAKKKPRGYGVLMVAPTGVEPSLWGPGSSRPLPESLNF